MPEIRYELVIFDDLASQGGSVSPSRVLMIGMGAYYKQRAKEISENETTNHGN